MAVDTESPDLSEEAAPRRLPVRLVVGGAVAVVALLVGVIAFSGSDAPDPEVRERAREAIAGMNPDTAALPLSTTYTSIEGAPIDDAPQNATDGLVVHPRRETPVHESPDGRALARMPTSQLGDAGLTWLPVIEQQPGWVRVLLPSKPNGSTGWIRSADVEDARTPFVINVRLQSKELQLVREGRVVDTWEAGIGKPAAPTPVGRTFLLGAFSDPKQKFSPVILPLGAHSPTLDTFGGGPGTVAIHTWPSSDVLGTETSDGCIRVPADALKKLTEVPLGTLVMITDD